MFADDAFQAPNLTSAYHLSKLDIRPGTNQLEILLKPSMANIHVFRKSIRTAHGTEISPDQALSYATLRSVLKAIGVLLGSFTSSARTVFGMARVMHLIGAVRLLSAHLLLYNILTHVE